MNAGGARDGHFLALRLAPFHHCFSSLPTLMNALRSAIIPTAWINRRRTPPASATVLDVVHAG